MEKRQLSDSELELMRVVWHRGGRARFAQVMEALAGQGKDWKANTVLTFLSRLVEKEMLAVEKNGRLNVYVALLREEDYADQQTRSFLDRVYGGNAGRLVSYLLKQDCLTAEDLDELKAFQQKDSAAQLLFIAEQYLGRTLSPSDVRSILFFSDRLHFSDDLIDYLLQYCVERGKKDFRYIEKVAVSWAEAGVTTPAEAEKQAVKYDKTVYAVMNALGKTNAPTRREAGFIRRWREDLGFELPIIQEACERTVLATDRHRFEYADKILSSWKESGVRHLSDIARLDEGFQKEKPARQGRERSADRYNRFMQNSYDYDALEKELLHI